MKCLLILAVTIAAVAGSSNLFDPSDGVDPCCTACGDPMLRTYDRSYIMLLHPAKTLFTQWKDTTSELCKFQVRCVMVEVGDRVEIDWCGISFHPHKNPKKFFRNWVFGQCLAYIGERGQGIYGPVERPTMEGTGDEYHFPPRTSGSVSAACNDFEQFWSYKRVQNPACCADGDFTYHLKIDRTEGRISIRTPCCGWSVDFWPRRERTCIKICVQRNHSLFSSRVGKMSGICGNMNDNDSDDWSKCDGSSVPEVDEVSMQRISDSCSGGPHLLGRGLVANKPFFPNGVCGPP